MYVIGIANQIVDCLRKIADSKFHPYVIKLSSELVLHNGTVHTVVYCTVQVAKQVSQLNIKFKLKII